ncbi:MAG: type II toxin-antitoxin system VapC family toxin [Bacillota bacterium]
MKKVLLDSDILIDHLRGYEKAWGYLKKIESGELEGYISVISEAELSAGGKLIYPAEEKKLKELLRIMHSIPIDSKIAWKAGEFRRKYNIRLMDGLIAATAYELKISLVTRNIKHFEGIGEIRVEQPYD